MQFNLEDEDLVRFNKSYVGVVESPGMTCDIQETFYMEGYFTIKVTPLGTNPCLLEDGRKGELKALVNEAHEWLGQLWCYGISCHA